MFIAKYDTHGKVIWARKAGGSYFQIGQDITLDAAGNSYVTGHFQEEVTFGDRTLKSRGKDDVFLAKYNAAGEVVWAIQAGGPGSDFGQSVAVDAKDNCFRNGHF